MVFADYRRICTFAPGELAEWSIAAVLKTVELWKVPGVRIPNSPPPFKDLSLLHRVKGFFYDFYFSGTINGALFTLLHAKHRLTLCCSFVVIGMKMDQV